MTVGGLVTAASCNLVAEKPCLFESGPTDSNRMNFRVSDLVNKLRETEDLA